MSNTIIEVLNQEAIINYEKQNELKYNYVRIIPLDIRSKKACAIFTAALICKYENRPQRTGRYNYGGQKGGGLLCMTDAHYAIDDMDQVYVIFGNRGRVTDYCRAATGFTEITKSIKDKIANSLKEWFMDYQNQQVHVDVSAARRSDDYYLYQNNGSKNSFNIVQAHGCEPCHFNVSKEEYRCLYETLKGRDKDKIKAKYGNEIYKNLIGSKIEDQFVISAVEVIRNEINNTMNEKNARLGQIEKEYNERYQTIVDEKKAAIKEVTETMNKKINELNMQLAEIMANAVTI